ncbi:meiosis protein SPO22/ZIP4 like-domain-containing protein [Xylogone sp. PMI_703]|nr:meiosis protein SPO22/ZIP4 like-domain-containing protein [Xylogone sp. PMI_703]
MAPFVHAAHPSKDKRFESILSFSTELQTRLPNIIKLNNHESLFHEIENQIQAFPSKQRPTSSSLCQEIDKQGTSLWNLCTRLRRDEEVPSHEDVTIMLTLARIFAFLLLDIAQDNEKMNSTSRLMKVGIKAAKNCLEMKQLDLAVKVLEKVAGYQQALQQPDSGDLPDKQIYERLSAEYFIIRTALAWQQNQLDIAEHMFKKSASYKKDLDSDTAESLADTLYEIGRDLLVKKQYQLATKWLDRALDIFNIHEIDRLSIDASEFRISIIQGQVKSLLGLQDAESVKRASNLIDLLENEVGDKLIVLILRLELISADSNDPFNSTLYGDVLRRMAQTMVLSDANLKLILYHTRKLNDKSPSLACKALDELQKSRLLHAGRIDWIERVLVTRLYLTVSQRESSDTLTSLEGIIDHISSNLNEQIGSTAALAAHTLLWKRIESNYKQGQYEISEKWCQLAMHKIFETSGKTNMTRIARKLLLCALARQDLQSARGIYDSMSEAAKDEPMTRFLMYKIAIRCGDVDLASECLEKVSLVSTQDSNLLYACVLDAQQVGNRDQAVKALQLVLEKHNYGAPSEVHLPSLLRVTIGLMVSRFESEGNKNDTESGEDVVEKLCKLFEGAISAIKKEKSQPSGADVIWTVSELEWFSKNSYNLGIKNLACWTPRHSVRILAACVYFIDFYPNDISSQVSDDLVLRRMFCEFSIATGLVALARGEDAIETQLQDYLSVRKHVENFDKTLQERLDKLEEAPAHDLLTKLGVLLAYDFEAACHLKAWDSLGEIILRADICKTMRIYEIMADCILSSQAPTTVLIMTLKKIVNAAFSLDSFDAIKLAKYMRCLFQIALPETPAVAEQLLDQIHSLAEELSETPLPYPTEELEWITSTAFNHAIDLFCAGDDEATKIWAGKALNIAHLVQDGGALERVLQSKLLELKWDVA